MKHGSLFSGIGGFDLAAEWMGWKNIFHCEKNHFCQTILNYYWPNATLYDDIANTDFNFHKNKIDVLTGGFPCQPFSNAGERRGTADPRHLWPEMLRAVREIQPRWVVGENVRGLISWNGGLVFDQVQTDLAHAGYKVLPFLLPACAVNAPHRRERIWFIAYRGNTRIEGHEREPKTGAHRAITTTDANRFGTLQSSKEQQAKHLNENGEKRRTLANPRSAGQQKFNVPSFATGEAYGAGSYYENVTNTESIDKQHVRTSQGQPEIKIRGRGIMRDWRKFPTQSPVCSRNDGLSSRLDGITFSKWRNESIKAAGNAIVPQVALQIFKAIEAYEHTCN